MSPARHALTAAILSSITLTHAALGGGLEDLAAAKTLSDAQREEIKSAIDTEVKSLGSSTPATVIAAREHLSNWADHSPTPVFRGEFSKVACGPLSELVLRAEPIQAVNAIEVLRVIGTYDALQHLAKLASSATVPNTGVRLAASRALLASIESGTDMNSAQADGLVRGITEATKREAEWGCSYSQLTALGAIAKRSGMDAKVVKAARMGQVAGLAALAAKVAKGDPGSEGLMRSASRVLPAMRLDLANSPAAERPALAEAMQPVLDALRKVGVKPPADASADLVKAYADTVSAADAMATLLKSSAGAPKGRPGSNKPSPSRPPR